MADFNQVIDKLNQDYEKALAEATPEAASRLSTIFEELGTELREYVQGETKDKMKAIIRKLDKNQPIDSEDKELIKLWIVGDAEAYTRMENNVREWVDEVKRIIGEITKFKGEDIDVNRAFALRAFLRDGSRVLADIFYYLEEKQRIKNFTDSAAKIDDTDRRILVQLLEQKIESSSF